MTLGTEFFVDISIFYTLVADNSSGVNCDWHDPRKRQLLKVSDELQNWIAELCKFPTAPGQVAFSLFTTSARRTILPSRVGKPEKHRIAKRGVERQDSVSLPVYVCTYFVPWLPFDRIRTYERKREFRHYPMEKNWRDAKKGKWRKKEKKENRKKEDNMRRKQRTKAACKYAEHSIRGKFVRILGAGTVAVHTIYI